MHVHVAVQAVAEHELVRHREAVRLHGVVLAEVELRKLGCIVLLLYCIVYVVALWCCGVCACALCALLSVGSLAACAGSFDTGGGRRRPSALCPPALHKTQRTVVKVGDALFGRHGGRPLPPPPPLQLLAAASLPPTPSAVERRSKAGVRR